MIAGFAFLSSFALIAARACLCCMFPGMELDVKRVEESLPIATLPDDEPSLGTRTTRPNSSGSSRLVAGDQLASQPPSRSVMRRPPPHSRKPSPPKDVIRPMSQQARSMSVPSARSMETSVKVIPSVAPVARPTKLPDPQKSQLPQPESQPTPEPQKSQPKPRPQPPKPAPPKPVPPKPEAPKPEPQVAKTGEACKLREEKDDRAKPVPDSDTKSDKNPTKVVRREAVQ